MEIIKLEVDQLKKQIASLKEQAQQQGLAFSSIEEEQLIKKVKGETSKSPFIYAQSWSGGATLGGNVYYNVYVRNPDPNPYNPFCVTIFFGLGNFFAIDQGWIGRDKRWPEISSDSTYFPSNSDRNFSFNFTVPSSLPLGTVDKYLLT